MIKMAEIEYLESCGIKYAVIDGAYHFVDFVTEEIEERSAADFM